LHPGSGSERKNWPEQKWAELLERLVVASDARLLLVGGEAEGDRLERLASRLPPHRVEVARNLPLTELSRRLMACAAFVGHDSGITHLAAALGIPGMALWGETVREVWAPRNPNLEILAHESGLAGLETDTVFAALEKLRRATQGAG
jgi:heptosyltransferase-2